MPTHPGPIVDCHLHVVDRGRLRYPWLAGAPALDRDWPLDAYEAEARACGVERALFMEADVAPEDIGAEIAFAEALCAREGSLVAGVIAACRPEARGFAAEVERAQARPGVVGLRRALHVVPDDASRTPLFRENLRRLGPAGLPFDLCVLARQLPLAIELADAAPDTRLVLDHCGVPDIAGDGWDAWARDVAALAERSNVWAKVSGLPAYAAPGWTAADLGRWVGHVLDRFGPERLVWGGDWPVCTLGGSLTTWVEATRAILAEVSAEERAMVLRRNAERVWAI